MPLLGIVSPGIAVAPVFYSSDTMGLPLPAHFELTLGIGETFRLKPCYIPPLLQTPMNRSVCALSNLTKLLNIVSFCLRNRQINR
jgi:hypothetical protein